jgi:eukaryotic-like serine/threonine-protein kinase
MTATDTTGPAHQLAGRKLANGWTVTTKALRSADATGGHFSVCYHVERHHDGVTQRGFLKALDYWPAISSDDPPGMLQLMTKGFVFERELIAECQQRRMRNVVRGLDAGEVKVEGFGPLLERVNYIIFEAAEGDLRQAIKLTENLDLVWTLRTLHNISNGLRQLHDAGICHQDLKPSNVLEFRTARKLSDLGRSYRNDRESPHDHLLLPGHPAYAPPEQLYNYRDIDDRFQRRAGDLYQIGSLLFFLFTGASMTPALLANIDSSHWPAEFSSNYDQALPMIHVGFDRLLTALRAVTPAALVEPLSSTFIELAHPDYRLRGLPHQPTRSTQRLSLDRYVTRFDLWSRRAELLVRQLAS